MIRVSPNGERWASLADLAPLLADVLKLTARIDVGAHAPSTAAAARNLEDRIYGLLNPHPNDK